MDLSEVLTIVTILLQAIGGIWVVVLAFQEEWIDGLLCVLLFPYLFYYAYKNYHDKKRSTKIPAHILILGVALPILMILLGD